MDNSTVSKTGEKLYHTMQLLPFLSKPDQPPPHQSCDWPCNAVVTNTHLPPRWIKTAQVDLGPGCPAAPLISQSSKSSIPAVPQVLPPSHALLAPLLPYYHFPILGYLLEVALPSPSAPTDSSTQMLLSLQLYQPCSRMLLSLTGVLSGAWVAGEQSWCKLAGTWAQMSVQMSLHDWPLWFSVKGANLCFDHCPFKKCWWICTDLWEAMWPLKQLWFLVIWWKQQKGE